MLILNMTKKEWQDFHKGMKVSNLNNFKKTITDIYTTAYSEAYKDMVTVGVVDVQNVLMPRIEEVLHKEFGIGKKRFEKFQESLEQNIQEHEILVQTSIEETSGEGDTETTLDITSEVGTDDKGEAIVGVKEHDNLKEEIASVQLNRVSA